LDRRQELPLRSGRARRRALGFAEADSVRFDGTSALSEGGALKQPAREGGLGSGFVPPRSALSVVSLGPTFLVLSPSPGPSGRIRNVVTMPERRLRSCNAIWRRWTTSAERCSLVPCSKACPPRRPPQRRASRSRAR